MTDLRIRRPGVARALAVVMPAALYAAALVVLLLPTFFLGIGVQALGARAGLWPGDPNTNDGEETWATAGGVLAYVIVLVIAAIVLRLVAPRLGLRSWPGIAIGTAVVVAFAILFCVWLIAPTAGRG